MAYQCSMLQTKDAIFFLVEKCLVKYLFYQNSSAFELTENPPAFFMPERRVEIKQGVF